MEQLNEVNLFIQKNEKFYEKKFKKMRETGKSISWNWAAFFMGIYWMIYRKMYFKSAAFLLLSMVASATPYIGWLLNIGILIGIAVYANALYLEQIDSNIQKANLMPEQREIVIKKFGGTNMAGAVAMYIMSSLTLFIGM